MNELQKELRDLKAKVAELEARVVAKPAVKKWEPKGGDFFIGSGGSVSMYDSRVFTKDFGMERETRDRAERAAVEMRRFNRLLALRDELCEDDVAIDWDNFNQLKYGVSFYHVNNEWRVTSSSVYESFIPYFTTKEAVERACDMLNSGEVEL